MVAPRIVIIEDEAIVAMDIEDRLASLGYKLAGHAVSGAEAVQLAQEQRPDLVLMDIRLKGDMDGIAAAEVIRQQYHIPIIFLTAYSEDETLERAKLTEPFGYLLKPFQDRKLKSAIEIALYKHRAEEEIRRLNCLYDVLRQVNQTVVRVRSQEELLPAVCRLLVARGDIDLAWIGWLDMESSRLSPVASWGEDSALLRQVVFFADDRPGGQGAPGQAVHTGRPAVCNRCVVGQCPVPADHTPGCFGFPSCGAFPLRFQGQVCGALCICSSAPDFFGDREINLLEEVALDVSFALDKIAAEVQLQESEARLRIIYETAQTGIIVQRTDGVVTVVNKVASEILNMSEAEITCKTSDDPEWHMILADGTPVPGPEHPSMLTLRTGQPVRNAIRGVFADDPEKHRWLLINTEPIRDSSSGEVKEVTITLQDITELKRTEEALRESEARLSRAEAWHQTVLKTVRDGYILVGGQGQILDVNEAYCTMMGFSHAELCQMSIADVEARHSKTEIDDNLRLITLRGSVLFETRHRTKSGRAVDIEASVTYLPWDGGRFVSILRDITERKQAEAQRQELEAQLFQAQKMEAIGTLAGGIAHDFNNIPTAIMGFTELAQFSAGSESEFQANLEQVLKTAHRAKDLVKQILTFSRQDKQELKPVQAGLILLEALKFLRSTLPSTIEIRARIEAKNTKLMADPTQLHQVLMNLCTNAGYAMRRQGGLLEATLTETVLEEKDTAFFHDLLPGPYLRLEVSDTGEGIPPAALKRIFEPFYTTKSREEGTGLGLAVVHGIIKSMGGDVRVASEAGQGTTFSIYLPIIAAEEQPVSPTQEGIPRGHERILFVDDEVHLAEMATQMLSNLGYQVTTRTSPVEALRAFQDHPDSFDLVITDQTMPQMTGDRFACELLHLRPDIPIILCTGFSESITPEKARRLGIRKFVMKPLAFGELAVAMREALAGKED